MRSRFFTNNPVYGGFSEILSHLPNVAHYSTLILNAKATLLFPKLWHHNVERPTHASIMWTSLLLVGLSAMPFCQCLSRDFGCCAFICPRLRGFGRRGGRRLMKEPFLLVFQTRVTEAFRHFTITRFQSRSSFHEIYSPRDLFLACGMHARGDCNMIGHH